MSSLSPSELRLLKLAEIADNGEPAIAVQIYKMDERLEEVEEQVKSVVQEVKNVTDEIESVKQSLPTAEEIASHVTIPDPIPGEPGRDGTDYILTERDRYDIAAKIKVPIVEKIIERVETIREMPSIREVVKETITLPAETPEQLRDKLESLKGDDRIDASAIKNLPTPDAKGISPNVYARPYTSLLSSLSDVSVPGILNGQTLQWDGHKWVAVTASSGGYTVETPSGSLYNQATGTGGITFTVTATPVYIVADGGTFFENFGYTLSGLTVTMTNPVTQFIRSFHS